MGESHTCFALRLRYLRSPYFSRPPNLLAEEPREGRLKKVGLPGKVVGTNARSRVVTSQAAERSAPESGVAWEQAVEAEEARELGLLLSQGRLSTKQ